MIFQHTWQAVLEGRKTQTRRLYKTGESLAGITVRGVVDMDGYPIYSEGRIYALQPGRGKKAVGRFTITHISRQQDVRLISEKDAYAEGYDSPMDFLRVWCGMHDKRVLGALNQTLKDGFHGGAYQLLRTRPAELYRAWVYHIEVVC